MLLERPFYRLRLRLGSIFPTRGHMPNLYSDVIFTYSMTFAIFAIFTVHILSQWDIIRAH